MDGFDASGLAPEWTEQRWQAASGWYWGGMGGFSDWVDDHITFGTTKEFGKVGGRYDAGKASAGEVAWAATKWGTAVGSAALSGFGVGKGAVGAAGMMRQRGFANARDAFRRGATEIFVDDRRIAEQLLTDEVFPTHGILRNSTSIHPNEIESYIGNAAHYHWDEMFDKTGRLVFHGEGNPHAFRAHLQIEFPGQDIIRVIFGQQR